MKKFIVEKDFWDLFPEAKIGVILCRGIDNSMKNEDYYKDLLSKAEVKAMSHLTLEEFSANAVISVWREGFQRFKTKKGARSSIEALLKRVQSGNHIGSINPLVDLYNSISLSYALPCGGEDMDSFAGDVRLTKAAGDEAFITLGSDESSPPYEGEIVYKDDAGAICRCLNWRESVRTMLTETTTDAFMCLELIDTNRLETLTQAMDDMADLIRSNLGGTTSKHVLSTENREIILRD